ncbi:MAG: hypothetical protein EP343_31045 [Deltaproteobacteria bacterium]|nr:MAG: hypothetical protein EP343_31045 [Deltaproteobacteria bacterium]
MNSFSKRLAIALIVLSLVATLIPLIVGWRFLVALEPTSLVNQPEIRRKLGPKAESTLRQQWVSLQTGYFWASVALLAFALFAALLVGWLLYRWLFADLFQLRAQIRQSVPDALPPLDAGAAAQEPVSGLQRDLRELVTQLLEQQQNEIFKEQVARWQDVAKRLAHEIRNPLTPILLSVQELQKQYPRDDARFTNLLDSSVSIVQEEITALRRIVDEFSAFAKLPEVRPAPQDLSRVVSEFLDAYNWFRDRAEVVLDSSGEVLWVRLDRMLFRRVLHNLVENAIEAGSSVVLIRTGALPTNEVLCQVEDRGPGIPEHLQSKIFTPYFTTKQLGTGLGLSITKKIIIDHGGAITASANPDGGSTFTIRLPVLRSSQ